MITAKDCYTCSKNSAITYLYSTFTVYLAVASNPTIPSYRNAVSISELSRRMHIGGASKVPQLGQTLVATGKRDPQSSDQASGIHYC